MTPIEWVFITVGVIMFILVWVDDKKIHHKLSNKLLDIEAKQAGTLETLIDFKKGLDKKLHTFSHDLQQIKTRQSWSKKRERKDLAGETKLSTPTKRVIFNKTLTRKK